MRSLFDDYVETFNRAIQVFKTPFVYDIDLYEDARPVSIGSPRKMIENGDYREAIVFVMLIFNRSAKAIQNDAPEEEKAKYMESYRKAMNTLGFTSEQVIIERAKKLKEELLPEIMNVAEYIIENNPNIIK